MKGKFFEDFGKPILVLTVIALVVGVLLGTVNHFTAPVIAENKRIRAEETRLEALPGATAFTEMPVTEDLGINDAYRENNGLGYVFTASRKGYGGDVVVTVSLSPEGKVIRVIANVSTETTGVGSKAGEESYLNKYVGIQGSADEVDTISRATYSSKAVKEGVSAVLKAFDSLVKGGAAE